MGSRPIVHHIPVCPFSQRLEILLALKDAREAVEFRVVDITQPRDPELLQLTRGSTALPVMSTKRGLLKESLVILRFLDESVGNESIARENPYEGAVENMLISLEGSFTAAGYRMMMNQDRNKRTMLVDALRDEFRQLEDFLVWKSPGREFLFETFGLAEAVFTPMFMRFWFLEYYEGFALPMRGFTRVAKWRDACLAHPAAQQVTREEIIKLYYDYAKGAGNGALPTGRNRSSFAFEPHWRDRPWPPADKYGHSATDEELGLACA
jgi:glutathione S-transferase